MQRRIAISLILAAIGASIAAYLFDSALFGLAHANPLLLLIYLPIWPSNFELIPRMTPGVVAFAYEFLYFFIVGLVFSTLMCLKRAD